MVRRLFATLDHVLDEPIEALAQDESVGSMSQYILSNGKDLLETDGPPKKRTRDKSTKIGN